MEDDAAWGDLLAKGLTRRGFEASWLKGADEALSTLSGHAEVDVVLTDLQCPACQVPRSGDHRLRQPRDRHRRDSRRRLRLRDQAGGRRDDGNPKLLGIDRKTLWRKLGAANAGTSDTPPSPPVGEPPRG